METPQLNLQGKQFYQSCMFTKLKEIFTSFKCYRISREMLLTCLYVRSPWGVLVQGCTVHLLLLRRNSFFMIHVIQYNNVYLYFLLHVVSSYLHLDPWADRLPWNRFWCHHYLQVNITRISRLDGNFGNVPLNPCYRQTDGLLVLLGFEARPIIHRILWYKCDVFPQKYMTFDPSFNQQKKIPTFLARSRSQGQRVNQLFLEFFFTAQNAW